MKYCEMLVFPLIVLTLQDKSLWRNFHSKAVSVKDFAKIINLYTSSFGLVPQDATYFSNQISQIKIAQ